MRLMLPIAVGAIFVFAGLLFDSSYQRSTPNAVYVALTLVVGTLARPESALN
jgi:hypothetical protein